MGGGKAGFPDAGNVNDLDAWIVNTTALTMINTRIIGSVNLYDRPKYFNQTLRGMK